MHSLKPISFIFVTGTTVAAGETVVHVFRQVYVRRFAGAVSTSIVQRFFLAGEVSLLQIISTLRRRVDTTPSLLTSSTSGSNPGAQQSLRDTRLRNHWRQCCERSDMPPVRALCKLCSFRADILPKFKGKPYDFKALNVRLVYILSDREKTASKPDNIWRSMSATWMRRIRRIQVCAAFKGLRGSFHPFSAAHCSKYNKYSSQSPSPSNASASRSACLAVPRVRQERQQQVQAQVAVLQQQLLPQRQVQAGQVEHFLLVVVVAEGRQQQRHWQHEFLFGPFYTRSEHNKKHNKSTHKKATRKHRRYKGWGERLEGNWTPARKSITDTGIQNPYD